MHIKRLVGAAVVAALFLGIGGFATLAKPAHALTPIGPTSGAWKVTQLADAVWARSIPGATTTDIVQTSEDALAVDVNGDGRLNDIVVQIRRNGTRGPAFIASFLELEQAVTGGLFVWAQERPGVDLDGNGRTDQRGYFWVAGDGPWRFVKSGKPYVASILESMRATVFGNGAGIAVVDGEVDSGIDFNGDGLRPGDFAVTTMRAGGLVVATDIFVVATALHAPQIQALGDGWLGGALLVRSDGTTRRIAGGFPVAHLGDSALYATSDGVGQTSVLRMERPGQPSSQLPAGTEFVSRGPDFLWVGMTEQASGQDVNRDGSLSSTGRVLCTVVAAGTLTCFPVHMSTADVFSVGDGWLLVHGSNTLSSGVGVVRYFLVGPVGVVAEYFSNSVVSLGADRVAMVTTIASTVPGEPDSIELRAIDHHVVSRSLWSSRDFGSLAGVRSLHDGRALVSISEGLIDGGEFGRPDPLARDLNGNGYDFDTVTYLLTGSTLLNLGGYVDVSDSFTDTNFNVPVAGGPLFVAMSEPGVHRDLNGDGDQADSVAFVIDETGVTNLRIAVSGIGKVESARPIIQTSELWQNVDLDGNGVIGGEARTAFEVSRKAPGDITPVVPDVVPPAATGPFSRSVNGWNVSYVGPVPEPVTPIPGSGRGASLRRPTDFGTIDLSTLNGRPVLQVQFASGSLGPPFVGMMLDDDSIDIAKGMFVAAQERPGVDLDGDGRTDHSGYFWVTGNGDFRFVRSGWPAATNVLNNNVEMFGDGAGIAVVENELSANADLDGNGLVESRTNAVVVLLAGGVAGGVVTFKDGIGPFGRPTLERRTNGVITGSVFVSAAGQIRLPTKQPGSPNSVVTAGYDDVAYYYDVPSGVTWLDAPGTPPIRVDFSVMSVGKHWAWAADRSRLCRLQLNTVFECYAFKMAEPVDLRDGTYAASVTEITDPTNYKVAMIDNAGGLRTVEGRLGPVTGAGQALVFDAAWGSGAQIHTVRLLSNGHLGDVLWTGKGFPDIRTVGDGRFFLNERELLAYEQGFVDLNGDGLGGGVRTWFYDGASFLNTHAEIDVMGFPLASGVSSQVLLGGPIFVSVAETGPARDLNGDGDTSDYVLHVIEGSVFTNLGVGVGFCCGWSSQGPLYVGVDRDRAHFVGSERGMDADLNGSGIVGAGVAGLVEVSRVGSHPPATRSGFVQPARVLDTRPGGQVGYSGAKPSAGQTVEVQIAGVAGVPASGVRSVALNVTVADATDAGFVTVWGDGARPDTSNVNIERAGQTVPNLVVVPVGADGKVRLFTDGGAHLLADVAAWWGDGSGLQPLTPSRLLDTRGATKPAPGSVTDVQVAGRGGAPASGSMVAVLNVTVTAASGPGFVTVWGDGSRPDTSNLNAAETGQTIANLVVVPVGADGKVHLYTDAGTHLLVDLTGMFVSGVAVDAPSRVLDTRSGAKPKPGSVVVVPLGLSAGTKAVVLNVTATRATGPGYITVWPDGTQPTSSNLNIEYADQTVPNLVIVPVGADGSIRIFTDAGTDLLVDVLGRFS
jgi:hypothetical protein